MRRRSKAKATPPMLFPPPELMPSGTPGRPWWGCYVGELPDSQQPADGRLPGAPLYAGPESAVLVIGPPRSGKTSALVIPSVLDAPGAVVSTSTKPDVLKATAFHRARLGRSYLFDPFATIEHPWWMHELRWSPVVGCQSFDRASAIAYALASAARPGAAATEAGHWVERAQALLTPLLFAAARRDLDMRAVCRWVLARDMREPLAIIEASGHQMASATLTGVAATDERELSGIFSAASGLLAAYRTEAVLASTVRPNFDPVAFAQSSDTLYICAPAQHQNQLAPLVVALLEQISAATFARPSFAAPVLFALDEVANIAPLPALPSLAAEGGGQGLVTLACLQDLSQARQRWGQAAEGFFTLFGVKVVLPGVADRRTLELISALGGDHEVPKTTVTQYVAEWGRIRPSVSQGTEFRPKLPIDAISSGRPGHALLINGSHMGEVRLVHWTRQAHWFELGDPARVSDDDLERFAPSESDQPW
jgi:type IV secretory pathway TraG/TraD family ATPase VirD4